MRSSRNGRDLFPYSTASASLKSTDDLFARFPQLAAAAPKVEVVDASPKNSANSILNLFPQRSATGTSTPPQENGGGGEGAVSFKGLFLHESENTTYAVDEQKHLCQTLQVDTIAKFRTQRTGSSGSLIVINDNYMCYALKGKNGEGLIRAIHRRSNLRALLRQHDTPVIDMAFRSQESNVLASVAKDGRLLTWAIVETQTAEGAPAVGYTPLRQLRHPRVEQGEFFSRILWQPNGGLIRDLLALVDGPRVVLLPFGKEQEAGAGGGLNVEHQSAILDLCWSPNGRALIAAGADGDVRVWRMPADPSMMAMSGTLECSLRFSPHSGHPVTALRAVGLSTLHGTFCLLTGSDGNRCCLLLWIVMLCIFLLYFRHF